MVPTSLVRKTSLVRNESYMKALNRRVERVLTGVAEFERRKLPRLYAPL